MTIRYSGYVRFPARRIAVSLAFLGIPLFPLFPLLRLHNAFYVDWLNHLWVIGYFGEYFARHGSFPFTVNTDMMIGLAIPVFYGWLFYPAAGLLSAVFGANLALRLLIFGLLSLQCRQVRKTVSLAVPRQTWVWAITLLTATAIYPLTNLYNRAAITELVSTSLLLSAFCCLLRIFLEPERSPWINGMQAGLFFALAAGVHPITGMLGGVFLAVWTACLVYVHLSRRLSLLAVSVVILTSLVLSPWLYALDLYQGHMQISKGSHSQIVFFEGIDSFGVRFSPFPYDGRALIIGNLASSPYLDAQINFPLLLLAAFLMFQAVTLLRQRHGPDRPPLLMAGSAFGGFIVLGIASTQPRWLNLIPGVGLIQFAYRLVTYLDLLLFASAVFLLFVLRPHLDAISRPVQMCLAISMALAIENTTIKYGHAAAVELEMVVAGTEIGADRNRLIQIPETYYGAPDYTMLDLYAGNVPEGPPRFPANLPVGTGTEFGRALDGRFHFDGPGYAVTNVVAFPWNRLTVNHRELPPSEIKTEQTCCYSAPRLAFPVEKGDYDLQYRLEPDPLWRLLRRVSFITILVWTAALCVVPAFRRNRARIMAVETEPVV
ncbi:MAG TPA: hypothetical protein VE959_20775 [Bryobacteraceae bacterium]|nr:hypothetical protein [Bryobacteraceae bacterium]